MCWNMIFGLTIYNVEKTRFSSSVGDAPITIWSFLLTRETHGIYGKFGLTNTTEEIFILQSPQSK